MLEAEMFGAGISGSESFRPEAMMLDEARCIHCELCYDLAPIIRGNEARLPVTHDTLEAMAACPTGAIIWCEDVWCEEPDAWDAVDEASWESFPASDAPGWRGQPRPGAPKKSKHERPTETATKARSGKKRERKEPL